MLENPKISNEKISACMQENYGLSISQLSFLPLGADTNTAVFRVSTEGGETYFLKLRTGNFSENSLIISRFLSQQGVKQIIPPLPSKSGNLWTTLDNNKLILYPFIEGKNGFDVPLSDQQWLEFGQALRQVHSSALPLSLADQLPEEDFSSQRRSALPRLLAKIENESYQDPLRRKLIALLKLNHTIILDLVRNAEWFAGKLRHTNRSFVLCHSDIHAGNMLIDPEGPFYIVDWDDLVLAPKERDLMFIGGGIGGVWNNKQAEILFYAGYGATEIANDALAYYRFERILEDIAIFIEEISSSPEVGEDRAQSFTYLASYFQPGSEIEIAYDSGKISVNDFGP